MRPNGTRCAVAAAVYPPGLCRAIILGAEAQRRREGKAVSEERIARLALDIMEEQGFDPVRAIASLSPESWLAPEGATRLLGKGYSGVVFLEEKTGVVVKVMLEDFAESEYKIFCDFADAGAPAFARASAPSGTPSPAAGWID